MQIFPNFIRFFVQARKLGRIFSDLLFSTNIETFCISIQEYKKSVEIHKRNARNQVPDYDKSQSVLLKIYHHKCAFCENELSKTKNRSFVIF